MGKHPLNPNGCLLAPMQYGGGERGGLHPVDETAKVSGLGPRWHGSRGFLLATSWLITLVCLLTKGMVVSGSGAQPESNSVS